MNKGSALRKTLMKVEMEVPERFLGSNDAIPNAIQLHSFRIAGSGVCKVTSQRFFAARARPFRSTGSASRVGPKGGPDSSMNR